jgi:putative acetyltransferase
MPVRPGTDADAAVAAELVRRVLREHGLPFEPAGADADILAPETHYTAAGGAFYVATDAEGTIVGTAALERTGPASGEVRKMFLLPEARGNGTGRALLDAVLAAARARRLQRVTLSTRFRYGRAIRMYERAGFQLVGSARQARDGEIGLIYQLDLTSQSAAGPGGPRRLTQPATQSYPCSVR